MEKWADFFIGFQNFFSFFLCEMAILTLFPNKQKLMASRHPWMYQSKIQSVLEEKDPFAKVYEGKNLIGYGLYLENDPIPLRVWEYTSVVPESLDVAITTLINKAIAFRNPLVP